MLGAIETRTIEAQPALVIRARGSAATIGAMLADLFPTVHQFIQRTGAEMAGPPFVRYLTMGNEWDFEAGAPVATAVPGEGRVEASSLAGGEVAVVTYTGPYEGVGEAHEAIGTWLAEQGRLPSGPPWDSYVTDPMQEPDSTKWRTDVYYPLGG
ncbi:MAG: GyrI-like domain-containing protein [Dehalococcoidia bacterium]